MEKIVGIKHSIGTFEGNQYDNYYVYAVDPEDKNVVFGACPNMYKVKAEVMHKTVSASDVNKLNGYSVEFLYDKYKNVASVHITK